MARTGTTPDVQLATLRGDPVTGLVEAAGLGNQDAWQDLLSRFSPTIATVAQRHQLSPAAVTQVQQATWLRLVVHLDRIPHPECLGRWLEATARDESLKLLMQNRKMDRPPC